MSDSEVLEVRDDLRVRLFLEDSPEVPYNEGGSPILEFPYPHSRSSRSSRFAPTFLAGTGFVLPDNSDSILAAAQSVAYNGNDFEKFERYLRMFHGTKVIKWYESRDSRYVTFDTASWREHHGITDEAIKPVIDQDYLNSVNLDEWQAYVEGDVWGYIVEERNNWLRVSPLNASNGTTPDMMETWEKVEATWGFYGRKYAEEAAREALTEEVSARATTQPTYYKYPL